MFAGLAIGRMGVATNAPRRLAIALAAWGLGHAVVGVSGEPLVLGLTLLVAGATIAPTFVAGRRDARRPGSEGDDHRGLHVDLDRDRGRHRRGQRGRRRPLEASSPAVAMAALGAGAVLASLVVRASAAGPLGAVAPAPA